MGIEFTDEQKKVIAARNSDILVSAAAGSGKTAVLVERILRRVMDEKEPVDIDRMLIMTFTKAAAAEMRDRLSAAFSREMAKAVAEKNKSLSTYLSRQLSLLRGAYISTIDSFCTAILRNNFSQIGLDPAFRVVSENERKLIISDTIEQVLEQTYMEAEGREEEDETCLISFPEELYIDPEAFYSFLDNYSGKVKDTRLEETILELYEFSQSAPDPEEYLINAQASYELKNIREFFENPVIREYFLDSFELIRQLPGRCEKILGICQEADGPLPYARAIESDKNLWQSLAALTEENKITYDIYNNIQLYLKGMAFTKFAAIKKDSGIDEKKKNYVALQRDKYKELPKKLLENYYGERPEEHLSTLQRAAAASHILLTLTRRFSYAFGQEKKRRGLVDFSDLEHFTLDIFYERDENGKRIPSQTALSYQMLFEEIMVDEYQDSNQVQEEILKAISRKENKRHNLFMVGDIKQSIYSFRQACPGLFNEKRKNYPEKSGDDSLRIDLHKNFRSRREVINCVNDIFSSLMLPQTGGVEYDSDAHLVYGAGYGEVDGDTDKSELHLVIERTDMDKKRLEACLIAERIRQLIDNKHPVWDSSTSSLRPARYSDIAVLLRSLKGYDTILTQVFTAYGIPCLANIKTGFFDSFEVRTILNYLTLINNPREDLTLCEALKGAFGNFSDEELAMIRIKFPDIFFYEAVSEYTKDTKEDETTEDQLQDKLRNFFQELDYYVNLSKFMPVQELIAEIISKKEFETLLRGMEDGPNRLMNLNTLLKKARDFGSSSFGGLYDFVRYISRMKKSDQDFGLGQMLGEKDDVVRIMTIHKSKGLEFPICFLSAMGKNFNEEALKKDTLMNSEIGIGIESVDSKRRTHNGTLIKKIIKNKNLLEGRSEELRILYVALTRAKEKLIMTGTVSEKEYEEYANMAKLSEKRDGRGVMEQSSYIKWVAPVAMQSRSCSVIRAELSDLSMLEAKKTVSRLDRKAVYMELYREKTGDYSSLSDSFSWAYPYPIYSLPAKFSVSQIKHAQAEETGISYYPREKEEEEEPLPAFMQQESEDKKAENSIGTLRGTAYHRFFELLDYDLDVNEKNIKEQLKKYTASGHMEESQTRCIRIKDFLAFGKTPLYERMRAAHKRGELYREQPFCMLRSAKEINPDYPDEEVMIQGIIDAAFYEEDGYVIVDYKTDRNVSEEELIKRYSVQLQNYAAAINQILGQKIKGLVIYSVALGKEIVI